MLIEGRNFESYDVTFWIIRYFQNLCFVTSSTSILSSMTRSPKYLCTPWLPLFSRNVLYEREILIFIMWSQLRMGRMRTGHFCPMKKNKSFYQEIIRRIPKTIILGYYTKLSSKIKPFKYEFMLLQGRILIFCYGRYLLKVRSRISTRSILDNELKWKLPYI